MFVFAHFRLTEQKTAGKAQSATDGEGKEEISVALKDNDPISAMRALHAARMADVGLRIGDDDRTDTDYTDQVWHVITNSQNVGVLNIYVGRTYGECMESDGRILPRNYESIGLHRGQKWVCVLVELPMPRTENSDGDSTDDDDGRENGSKPFLRYWFDVTKEHSKVRP